MKRVFTIAHVVWLDVLRRKDVYIVFGLLIALLVLLMSLNVFGISGVTGYIKETGLMLVLLFSWILALNISTCLLPEEESRGTAFSLLARPVTRLQVIVGKWLGCWTVVCAATTVFYAVVWIIIRLRGSGFSPLGLAQALCLHFCMLGMLSALGVAFSTRLNRDAAAAMSYTIGLAAFFLLPRVPYLLPHLKGFHRTALLALYYALPHFELFDMRMRLVHDFGPVPLRAFVPILVYGAVLMIAFLTLAWLGYRAKRILRGVV